jgi:hypothetical protein
MVVGYMPRLGLASRLRRLGLLRLHVAVNTREEVKVRESGATIHHEEIGELVTLAISSGGYRRSRILILVH